MTWMSKRKEVTQRKPELCARCHERLGTAMLHFTNNVAVDETDTAAKHAWLCDQCQRAVRDEAREN